MDSKKEIIEDYDSEDEDIDEETSDEVKSEFEKRLRDTKSNIEERIQNNESIKLHNILLDDINILFYSEKEKKIKNNEHTLENVKNTIKGVCLSRIERYSNIIQKVIKDSYNYIKKYVNKGSIEEEERNKRQEAEMKAASR